MTTQRRRPLTLTCAAVLCLTGALLLLGRPREAGGFTAGIVNQGTGVLIGVQGNQGGGCQFPATGQTTAYMAEKDSTPFVVVPDDGTVQAGEPLHYHDNGNGTITDKVTGLTWEKKSNDGGLHDVFNIYAWSSASSDTIWNWLDDVNAEGGTGFAHHRDWRIPNVKELESIIDFENFGPAVASVFNTNCGGNSVFTGSCTAASFYWSSSTLANNSAVAWSVNFLSGSVSVVGKSDALLVRAVRGGCHVGPED